MTPSGFTIRNVHGCEATAPPRFSDDRQRAGAPAAPRDRARRRGRAGARGRARARERHAGRRRSRAGAGRSAGSGRRRPSPGARGSPSRPTTATARPDVRRDQAWTGRRRRPRTGSPRCRLVAAPRSGRGRVVHVDAALLVAGRGALRRDRTGSPSSCPCTPRRGATTAARTTSERAAAARGRAGAAGASGAARRARSAGRAAPVPDPQPHPPGGEDGAVVDAVPAPVEVPGRVALAAGALARGADRRRCTGRRRRSRRSPLATQIWPGRAALPEARVGRADAGGALLARRRRSSRRTGRPRRSRRRRTCSPALQVTKVQAWTQSPWRQNVPLGQSLPAHGSGAQAPRRQSSPAGQPAS